MTETGRIAIYGLGIVCGIVIGASLSAGLRRWSLPAVKVFRCRACRAEGPHLDAVGLHYDSRGAVDLIALCCRHKAKQLWQAEEREPAGGGLRWRWPRRINGFARRARRQTESRGQRAESCSRLSALLDR